MISSDLMKREVRGSSHSLRGATAHRVSDRALTGSNSRAWGPGHGASVAGRDATCNMTAICWWGSIYAGVFENGRKCHRTRFLRAEQRFGTSNWNFERTYSNIFPVGVTTREPVSPVFGVCRVLLY